MPIRRARCGRCQAKSADNTLCIIEYFGNADAVPQPPERCLSRKAGIVRCCRKFIIQAIAIKIQSIPVFWCRIFAEHAWQQSLKTGNFLLVFIFRCFLLTEELFWAKKLPAQIGGQPMQEVYRFGHRLFIGSNVCFYNFTAIKGGIYRRKRSAQISQFFNHRMSFCLTPYAAFYPGGSYR